MLIKRKVLIFVDWFYPGYKAGGPIRSIINLVEHLNEFFDFYIITGDRDYHDDELYNGVNFNTWNNYKGIAKVYYWHGKMNSSKIKSLYKEVNPSVIYFNSMFSLPFSIRPLILLRNTSSGIILAPRGMLAMEALKIKRMKKNVFLTLFYLLGLPKRILFHATNENESADIKRTFPNANTYVAANLPGKFSGNIEHLKKEEGKVKLLSIARISPEKNLRFALNVLINVKYDVEFNIYGSVHDADYFDECRQLVKSLPVNITVNFYQPVSPDKLMGIIKKHHFLFLPTLGENYGHVIAESFACGRPVIISDQTPWKDLPEKNVGWDLSLNRISSFVGVINSAAEMTQEQYQKLEQASFEFGKRILNDEHVKEQNIKLLMQ